MILCFSIQNVFIISRVVVVMRHLSSCYRQQDRMDRAMRLANEALQIASSSLPINHAELGDCTDYAHSVVLIMYSSTYIMYIDFQEAASCHYHSRSYDEAIRLFERAGDVFSHHLPARATSLSIGTS